MKKIQKSNMWLLILISCLCLIQLADSQACMFNRYYWGGATNHFYSCNTSEVNSSYTWEEPLGQLFTSQVEGSTPLYRYFSASLFDHMYTITPGNENLTQYVYDGIAGYIANTSTSVDSRYCDQFDPIYRLYSSTSTDSFYTINYDEMVNARDNLGHTYIRIEGYICKCKCLICCLLYLFDICVLLVFWLLLCKF